MRSAGVDGCRGGWVVAFLEEGEVVLGWVTLPDRMSLHDPMGVYWNDRHLEAVFAP